MLPFLVPLRRRDCRSSALTRRRWVSLCLKSLSECRRDIEIVAGQGASEGDCMERDLGGGGCPHVRGPALDAARSWYIITDMTMTYNTSYNNIHMQT